MKTQMPHYPSTDAPCGLCVGRPYRTGMPLCSGCRDALGVALAAENEIADAMADDEEQDHGAAG